MIDFDKILDKGNITKLEGGDDNHTFLLTYKDKKYVLRNYKNKNIANYYWKLCKKIGKYNFIPKVYYKKDNKIILEYIEGRNCKKSDSLKVAEQVGKICAIINELKVDRNTPKTQNDIPYAMKILRNKKVLSKNILNNLEKIYLKYQNKLRPLYAIDLDDVYPENFRLRKGRVYLIDIDDIDYKFKGRGIGKSFLRWFKTDKERTKFKKGYESISSLDFLTQNYLQFLYLNFLLFSVAYKAKNKKKIPEKDLKSLLKINKGIKI